MGAGLDLYGRRKDGSEFPVEISLSPLKTDGGTLVSSAIRDITDRKHAERDASHFIAVVESSTDVSIGIAVIDRDTESDETVLATADHAMYEDKARLA